MRPRYHGRNIHFAGRAEKDRKSVAKAIKVAIGKIAKKNPALAAHLREAIQTSVFCSYAPAMAVNWEVANRGCLVASNE
jgi:DICT domain-containing protein